MRFDMEYRAEAQELGSPPIQVMAQTQDKAATLFFGIFCDCSCVTITGLGYTTGQVYRKNNNEIKRDRF